MLSDHCPISRLLTVRTILVPRGLLKTFNKTPPCVYGLPREFLFRVSYLEIYNEQINDLLCPASTMTNVRILESKKLGVQLQGVKEEVVISPQQVYALISAGEAQRHVGSTDANKVTAKR